MSKNNKNEERMILSHEPIPPYKTVFYIVFILGVIYLTAIIVLGLK
ncbi:MAG: hypothetical protein QMD43_03715 [Thermodesulfovibrio sp.]|nr:hypothetical protein [Thermodesulfovibrio sp. 1176]MDI1472256.1 hypothetical protein [Thermodesulfovibrio sp. 1176]MDI6714118.1 hypothetical protein [Thermodesulfovibrio sp.]